ncbi:alpha-tocopherol transfer protein-like [Chironomus tepperi]|uniref:alpha-tocopherol transfer protein-like n=1 Tax=Chironomus tepperi TaxID=113505 RepID=UPI00391F7961
MSAERLFKTYERELKEFEDWIAQNPRLPKNINKLLLLRFLKVYDFDIDAAKKLLVFNLETRKKHPELFSNRDVLSDEFQTAMSVYQCLGFRKNTKDNHKVTLFRISSTDASKFQLNDITRLIVAMMDCRFIHCDDNELIDGEISLVDMENFTFRHFTRIMSHLGILKTYADYGQEAAPIKIIETHFINCPSIFNKFMSFVKPFLGKQVRDTLICHSSLDSLYTYIPKDILPVDYGGTAEPLDEYHVKVKEVFESYRDYILCDDNWKIED